MAGILLKEASEDIKEVFIPVDMISFDVIYQFCILYHSKSHNPLLPSPHIIAKREMAIIKPAMSRSRFSMKL
jgi:hypothetical protein